MHSVVSFLAVIIVAVCRSYDKRATVMTGRFFSSSSSHYDLELLNSAGESDTSSPLSIGSLSDNAGDSATVVVSAQRPKRPPSVPLDLSLEGVTGAGKRGRRKGSRNRTPAERQFQMDDKRSVKNARERTRVQNVSQEYKRLREVLGDSDFNKKKKPKKLDTLNCAIKYIQDLMKELERARLEAGELPSDQAGPSNGSYPPATEPVGQIHMAAGNYELRYYGDGTVQSPSDQSQSSASPSINLSCDESLELNEDGLNSDQEPILYATPTCSDECTSTTTAPPGNYFSTICTYSPDMVLGPSSNSIHTLLTPSPGISDFLCSSSHQPMLPLPSFTSPELLQGLPPHLSQEASTLMGYQFPCDESNHQLWSTPLPSPSPPVLTHYPPPSILHS